MGPLLDRLKSGEAATVLRRLLKAHPDLSSEADEIARSLLRQLEYEDVAAEIEDEIRALDYEDLNARAGSHEWGYVEPSEACSSPMRCARHEKDFFLFGASSSVWDCRLIRRPAKDARRKREPCLGRVTRKGVWSSQNSS